MSSLPQPKSLPRGLDEHWRRSLAYVPCNPMNSAATAMSW